MADIYARQRQLIATTSGWASANIVLGYGEIGVEVASSSDVRIKIGDGTSTFSALPYASASSSTINSATQAALDAKLALAGGTMTGLLVLSGDPATALGAATKQYVDVINSTLSTSLSGKLSTSGGTLTGYLTLNGAPTSSLHAATKAYVDTGDAAKVNKSGDTMTGALVLAADPANALEAATKQYVDNGSYQTVVGGSSAYAGKVVKLNSSGVLDTSLVPVSSTYLGTVNPTLTYALSGSYSAGNYYAVSASGTIDASWSTHLNGSPTTCGAGQFIIYNANGKWDLVGDTSSSSAIAGKLDKSGGTMTGALILAADPTTALGAATKQYADLMVPKTGGTMTGVLTLSADPTSALHAATKQYADLKLALTGGTLSGKLTLAASASGSAGLGLTPGSAPSSPSNGDLWMTTSAVFARINGATLQLATTLDTTKLTESVQVASYTLALADAGQAVTINNASAVTLTIPANSSVAFPIGTRIDLVQWGAGQVTVAAASGVTIRSSGSKLKLSGQFSAATLWKRGSDEWLLAGDIAA